LKDQEEMIDVDKNWKVLNKTEFMDIFAPFDHTEDFSTASLMKNKGTSLTM
jgi:hypothetical protein